jgi:histidyl-tRNA synthetase
MVPVKWFSIPQCWRYETVTRGRRREHYQWNMDIIGVKEVPMTYKRTLCHDCWLSTVILLLPRDR